MTRFCVLVITPKMRLRKNIDNLPEWSKTVDSDSSSPALFASKNRLDNQDVNSKTKSDFVFITLHDSNERLKDKVFVLKH